MNLQDLANALAQVATWTQAIEAELATFKASATPSAKEVLQDTFTAVASAVDSTANAAAKANVANQVLTTDNPATGASTPADLATDKQKAGKKVKDFTDKALQSSAALVGRGC